MQTISALTMRRKFGHYMDVVSETKEPVVIERANRPLVALIPAEDLDRYEKQVRQREQRDEAVRRMDVVRSGLEPIDVVRLVRGMRDANGRP
ncbi:MAG TPA: type II toxin-antitoxin system prevent-host-death family antitoxin [Planctomycetota bacterium]|nr:type II toxin-antitoxin system prevent-host-death family antitoxin [Planctomycetota bacterium]HRR83228.1 type II toxin-antitoxin system prevent-host-death family antitoxin [Planctomycetota bacterium]HRT96901.1 type II toxin-antitoxin system prevent-host-death family antitoxin [Planctomycetota bacterium]